MKVTMSFICEEYPRAKFVMLATCEAYNPENYSNYIKNGMPVPSPDGSYTKVPMIDVDDPDHDDKAFDARVGDDDAWDLWTHGEKEWTGRRLKSGKRGVRQGTTVPITGGYGFEKHTLVAELPFFIGDIGNNDTK